MAQYAQCKSIIAPKIGTFCNQESIWGSKNAQEFQRQVLNRALSCGRGKSWFANLVFSSIWFEIPRQGLELQEAHLKMFNLARRVWWGEGKLPSWQKTIVAVTMGPSQLELGSNKVYLLMYFINCMSSHLYRIFWFFSSVFIYNSILSVPDQSPPSLQL